MGFRKNYWFLTTIINWTWKLIFMKIKIWTKLWEAIHYLWYSLLATFPQTKFSRIINKINNKWPIIKIIFNLNRINISPIINFNLNNLRTMWTSRFNSGPIINFNLNNSRTMSTSRFNSLIIIRINSNLPIPKISKTKMILIKLIKKFKKIKISWNKHKNRLIFRK